MHPPDSFGPDARGILSITYKGRRRSLHGWAKVLGLADGTLRSRLERGMSVADAMRPGTLWHVKKGGKKDRAEKEALAHERWVPVGVARRLA